MKTGSYARSNSNCSIISGIDVNSQKLITSNEAYLPVAIADLIISQGLSFDISQKPIFMRVLESARNISKDFITPNRMFISKELLDVINE